MAAFTSSFWKHINSQIRNLFTSVTDPGCLSRIRLFYIPHPGSRVKKIPDPHQKNLNIFFNPKNCFYALGSGSWFLSIPDPGVKKAPDPRPATLLFSLRQPLPQSRRSEPINDLNKTWCYFFSGFYPHHFDAISGTSEEVKEKKIRKMFSGYKLRFWFL
jgi:hypothetical protein